VNYWRNKKVLVTGCNGFVGAWLVKTLVDSNAKVVGIIRDRVPRSALELLECEEKISIVYGDVMDYELLNRAMNDYGVEICFHLAAQSQVGAANRSPVSTFNTNIFGTINVLEAARSLGCVKGVVVASSDKAYGLHKKLPYKEDFAFNGTYPYDASKACADILSQSYFNTYKLPAAIARCGNIYGPADLNMNRIIPDTIRSLCLGEAPVIRSDGKYVRDYIYVLDAVSAYLTLGQALVQRPKEIAGEAFNFGTGKPVSVIELVNAIIKISNVKIKPKILNIAKGEIREQYLSSDKADSVLGWRPAHKLEAALETTYEWYKNYFEEVL